MAINGAVQTELNEAIRRLRLIAGSTQKAAKQDLAEASKILVSAVKGRAPVSDREHKRYKNGRVVAVYQPGNLKKSFKTLRFRRSEAVFVGPKLGGSPDGYYAHFPEFGTVNQPAQNYVKDAVQSAGPVALNQATQLIKRRIQKIAAQNAVL